MPRSEPAQRRASLVRRRLAQNHQDERRHASSASKSADPTPSARRECAGGAFRLSSPGMTWRDAVTAWTSFETRHPVAWRTGVAGLTGGSVALVLAELSVLPPPAPSLRRGLISLLAILLVAVGRRLLWNDGERRLRMFWRLLAFNALIALLVFGGRAAGLPLGSGALGTADSARMLAAGLSLCLVLTLATLVAVRVIDRRPVREIGIVPCAGFWGDLAFGLILGALLMSAIFAAELALDWVRVVDVGRAGGGAPSFTRGFLDMLLLFVAVGFYEEVTSRGYVLRALAQGFAGRLVPPQWALALAVALSSAAFGLGHVNNPHSDWVSTLNIVMAGALLALPYVLTGRLAVSIGLHITWNLFQGSVYGFPVSGLEAPATVFSIEQLGPTLWTGGAFGPEAGLFGLLAMCAGALLIAWREKRRHGALELYAPLALGGV